MSGNMVEIRFLVEFTFNVRIYGAYYRYRIGIGIRGIKDFSVYRR